MFGSTLGAATNKRIKEAPYFSIIADTNQDVSKVDQLSIVYHYVQIVKTEESKPIGIKVKEVFLGFHAVSDQTASGITPSILKIMGKSHLDLCKCRGQAYDGVSTMSGAYSGVQTRLKEIQPNALYNTVYMRVMANTPGGSLGETFIL